MWFVNQRKLVKEMEQKAKDSVAENWPLSEFDYATSNGEVWSATFRLPGLLGTVLLRSDGEVLVQRRDLPAFGEYCASNGKRTSSNMEQPSE